ncbi:phage tail protein [Sphingomonas hengshuiensis]|uniref:Tip attachment protein J domain-containing protein n=1 Tax=Sphingomonas hengshuiensis TaxID=1609977 RepID=A0A7U4J8L1_9SPHN|nr:phage tail protein [Sphingomonas hengshuiensis]AJP72265.1 hypothetical protein TS85_11390 [Sphingomonas hengshuiensis]
MGKVVKVVALIGLAVGATLLSPALGAALVKLGASIGIGISTAVATAIASVVVATVIGLAMQALAGTPSAAKPSPINFRQAVGNSWIVIGLRRVGGQLIFFHPRKSGKDHYRYFIFAAAGHRCAGHTGWYLNDEQVTVDGSGMVTSGPYANAAWLWFGRGQYDVDETPSGWRAETGGKWPVDHVGYGIGKIYAKFKMTDAVVEAGLPTISAIVQGTDEIRDPRTGDTGWTDLAVPAFYWWMQLPREEGGFGATDDEIPDDDLLAAWTNICDEDVPLAEGGTEKRYTFDALIETGSEPSKVRQTFELCCAATAADIGGVYHMRPGYWVGPSATLLERDLTAGFKLPLLGDPQQYATEVTGTYIDPASNYQSQPVPTRSVESDSIRQLNYDLAHISSHTRGQRILEIMLRRALCERRLSWPMNIQGMAITPMQVVQCDTQRYSLSNYAFVVDDWKLAQDFGIGLELREENEDVYSWTTAMELPKSGTATPEVAEPIPAAGTVQTAIANSYPVGLTITAADGGAITISNHTRRYTDGFADVAVTGATIASGLAAGTFRAIAYDDDDRSGGAVTYALYADDLDARTSSAHPGRHYVGYAVIPTAGSPPAEGGGATPPGGACVTVDTPILMADGTTKPAGEIVPGDMVMTRHEERLSGIAGGWGAYPVEAVEIVASDDVWIATIGGKVLRATGDHLVFTGLWRRMRDIGSADGSGDVVKMTVTGAHTYVSNDVLSHNIKILEP